MIESLQTLFTNPSYPSLHVLVIHFPIAFICAAPLVDFGCLILRDRVWLDRAATMLYVIGTIGAGAAYLSGERAAKALVDISPAADRGGNLVYGHGLGVAAQHDVGEAD